MKKILALALALLVIGSSVALVACSGEDDQPDTDNPGTEAPDTDTPGADEPDTDTPEEPTTPTTPTMPTLTTVDELVIVNATVYYRQSPSYEATALGELRVGTILKRTGLSEEWSRIVLESGEFYTATNCLKLFTGTLPEEPSDEPTTPGDEPTNPGDEPTTPGDQPTTPGDEPTTPGNDPTDFVEISPSETVYVITDVLNIRSEPKTSGEKIGNVTFATPLERVAKNNEWSRIKYLDKEYYVYSEYLTTENVTGQDYIVLAAPKTMNVTASVLNVRSHPYVSDDTYMEYQLILKQLNKGDTVTVLAEAPSGTWVRIKTAEGVEAYVNGKYLSGYEGATGGDTTGGTTTPTTPSTPTVKFNPLTPAVMYPATSSVSVYSVCDDTTTPYTTLSRSDSVRVIAISEDGIWYKVNLSATDTTPYYVWVANLMSSGKS